MAIPASSRGTSCSENLHARIERFAYTRADLILRSTAMSVVYVRVRACVRAGLSISLRRSGAPDSEIPSFLPLILHAQGFCWPSRYVDGRMSTALGDTRAAFVRPGHRHSLRLTRPYITPAKPARRGESGAACSMLVPFSGRVYPGTTTVSFWHRTAPGADTLGLNTSVLLRSTFISFHIVSGVDVLFVCLIWGGRGGGGGASCVCLCVCVCACACACVTHVSRSRSRSTAWVPKGRSRQLRRGSKRSGSTRAESTGLEAPSPCAARRISRWRCRGVDNFGWYLSPARAVCVRARSLTPSLPPAHSVCLFQDEIVVSNATRKAV